MFLPNPLILGKPLHIWLGILTLLLLILQILVGKRIIKRLPFSWHTNIIWKVLIVVALIHAFYGFEIYFWQ